MWHKEKENSGEEVNRHELKFLRYFKYGIGQNFYPIISYCWEFTRVTAWSEIRGIYNTQEGEIEPKSALI